MSDRIGGAFPDDRPSDTERPRSATRPASFGAGGAGNREASRTTRPDRPSGYGSRPRPGADRERPGGDRERPGSDRDRPVRSDRPDRPQRRGSDRRSPIDLPRIPESITEDQLSREVRDELRGLPTDLAVTVGRYLVAAELATVPEVAYGYAQAARYLAARIGVVREVSGIAAYKTGRWAEALAELRAARRLTGRGEHLPLMADSERALGRLDRALELVHGDDAKRLPRAAQIELRIVESGIRRDQGLADAAVLALQVPELTDGKQRPWSARLFYAYGDALLAAGRTEAAREAFSRAVVADEDEQTDALARLDELDGIAVADLEDDNEDDEDDNDAELDSDAAPVTGQSRQDDDEGENEDDDESVDDLDDESESDLDDESIDSDTGEADEADEPADDEEADGAQLDGEVTEPAHDQDGNGDPAAGDVPAAVDGGGGTRGTDVTDPDLQPVAVPDAEPHEVKQTEGERTEAKQAQPERAEAERAEAERAEAERAEAERAEAERAEAERTEAERTEAEPVQAKQAEAEPIGPQDAD
jgi:tetratricopeptide (TPR) repeat protein